MAFKKVSNKPATASTKAPAKKPGFKVGKFNMLDFGKGVMLESSGKAAYVFLISLNGTHVNNTKVIKDEEGTEYTKAEALVVLANALDAGKAINCHTFDPREKNDKAVATGNVRVDTKGISRTLSANILKSLKELTSADSNELYETKQYLNVGRMFIDPGTVTNSTFKVRFCMFRPESNFETNEGFACEREDAIALLIAQLWSEAVYTNIWNNSGDLAGSMSVKIDEILKNNVRELLEALGDYSEPEAFDVEPREYELTEAEADDYPPY